MKNITLKNTINHWKKMLRWAKRQKPRNTPNRDLMYLRIKENWFDLSCELCKNHYTPKSCSTCPIVISGSPKCNNYDSIWYQVYRSRTWAGWCTRAKKMIKLLERIQDADKRRT